MAVSKRLRFEVLRRDNHTCRYCGATAPDVKLTIDHVVPSALGGSDEPSNLVTACEPCNSGKTSTPADAAIVADVAQDALRWAEAMKQVAADMEAQSAPKEAYRNAFKDAWDSWTWTYQGQPTTFSLDQNWRTSLERFRLAGLPAAVWPDIVEKAMTHPTVKADNIFRYCCGIAWRMVTEMQEKARALVSPTPASQIGTPEPLDARGRAIVDFWLDTWTVEFEEPPPADALAAFRDSVAQFLRDNDWEDPERLIRAAREGAWIQLDNLQEAIETHNSEERHQIVMEWADSWRTTCGQYPDSDRYSDVLKKVEALFEAGASKKAIEHAAVLAGVHLSYVPHFGIRRDINHKAGTLWFRELAVDLWSRSFANSALLWPSPDERASFAAKVDLVIGEGAHAVIDLVISAVTAGAYGDPDLTRCLPREGSALKAAAEPFPAAV